LSSGDYNGDGIADLAIGSAYDSLNGFVTYAGSVSVILGSRYGLSSLGNQYWYRGNMQDSPGTYDYFGSSLASGDFNSDGFDDLAIGVPGDDVNSMNDAGSLNVLYGSVSSLVRDSVQTWHQDINFVADECEGSDNFASRLAAGDVDGDGDDDLIVGIPFEDIGNVVDAGAVQLFRGGPGGISSISNLFMYQGSVWVDDIAEEYDQFGFALSVGDFDGDGDEDIAVGVPNEDIGDMPKIDNAGMVHTITGSSNGITKGLSITQNDVFGDTLSVEAGDRFGYALASKMPVQKPRKMNPSIIMYLLD
jgi:hypothetical protein